MPSHNHHLINNLINTFLLLALLPSHCCAHIIALTSLQSHCYILTAALTAPPVAALSSPHTCHCNIIAAALGALPLLHSHHLSWPHSHHCSLIAMLSSSSSLFLFLFLSPSPAPLFPFSSSFHIFHLIPHHLLLCLLLLNTLSLACLLLNSTCFISYPFLHFIPP